MKSAALLDKKTEGSNAGDASLRGYLAGESPKVRLDVLRRIEQQGRGMPAPLVKALFAFDIPVHEKIALLGSAVIADGSAAEAFIFDSLVTWDQELATRALRIWAGWSRRSNRAPELMRVAALPAIPQRILYTIMDIAPACARDEGAVVDLVKACTESAVRDPGGYLSPAFNGLMFIRMLQFHLMDKRVFALAESVCDRATRELLPDDKSAMAAWLYLREFAPAAFKTLAGRVAGDSPQRIFSDLANSKKGFALEKMVLGHESLHDGAVPAGIVQDDGAAPCLSWLASHSKNLPDFSNWAPEWQHLCAIGNPSSGDDGFRDSVAAVRSLGGVFRIAYIRALGRRAGSDEAVLKLLDFIRSGEVAELREVARALSAIGTSRALQEMTAMVSRPNAGVDLQLEIAGFLRRHDLTRLRSDVTAAAGHVATKVRELRNRGTNTDGLLEVWESLQALIEKDHGVAAPPDSAREVSVAEMDAALARTIPGYSELSAEVKRALRTAWYFDRQIDANVAASSIDLSPVIDMQYKALELLFREFFEDACSRLIQTGVIQRKLDLLGYSRPIPAKMDEFERFIGAMPVVESIPFFSKFKLRKMLLGLCQFKPGKRFTLDGLKAFGLFFLVFGRGDCRYGLEGIVPLVPSAIESNNRLAEFCRLLHVFQDDRNRAAHEGFRPDSAADIRGIWRNTAEIIQTAFALRKAFGRSGPEPALVRGRAS